MSRASSRADRWARWMFRLAVVVVAFGAGAYAEWTRPSFWETIRRGVRTPRLIMLAWRDSSSRLGGWVPTDLPADSLEAMRVRPKEEGRREQGLRDPVVMVEGRGAFNEHCPGPRGCLAVEYAGTAAPSRTWPLRAGLLAEAAALPSSQEKVPGVNSMDVMTAQYVMPYRNGDLLASFWYADWHAPATAGVARVGRDGRPLWFTTEGYSHHEGYVASGDTVWIPGWTLDMPAEHFPRAGRCQLLTLDRINVLDENGVLINSLPLLDAFLSSKWASLLRHGNHCDPFHLNSVSMVGEDVSGLPGVAPGDLVLSLKALNAIGIMDREARVVKRLVRGTFVGQHSVKHLRGSKFLVFDNVGGYAQFERARSASQPPSGPQLGWRFYSRVLVVDLANGEETVLFPQDPPGNARGKGAYSSILGRLSISPDRTRVLASLSMTGRAVELRIADGEVLTEFNFVHDVSRLERFPADRTGVIRLTANTAFYAHEAR